MTATDPAVPRRCTCPHFENEHEEGGGPCRAQTPAISGMSQPLLLPPSCSCPKFTPRDEPARRRAAAELREGERLPEQITARVLGIRDRAEQAGRLVTTEEQESRDAQRRAREQSTARAESARRALEILEGIPTRYRAATVTVPEVAAWVEHVTAGGTDSMVILGPTGTGKTHQSFAAFATVLRATGRLGMWTSAPNLLDALRPGRDEPVRLEDYQRTPLLLLDDLAVEKGSEWTTEVIYRLLDHRYVWCLPTILTTNVPPAEVRERLGERIASRLNGMGRRVVLEGEDRRTPRRG